MDNYTRQAIWNYWHILKLLRAKPDTDANRAEIRKVEDKIRKLQGVNNAGD